VARLIDFGPEIESPLHRAMSIDYGIVVEGTFELSLDSDEKKIMFPGDMSKLNSFITSPSHTAENGC
jgi:quercetin dioxygenase-like cupin family protein